MVKIGNVNLTEHKPNLKMGEFISINVDVESNNFCAAMQTTAGGICAKCYGKYMIQRYPRLKRALLENYFTLSTRLLNGNEISEIGDYVLRHAKGLRFNSIGELINENHADNFNLIAMYIKAKSPNFPITLWSKRTGLSQVIDRNYIKKIYSNPLIDNPIDRVPEGFNGVFNVCTAKWFKEKRCAPNCGGHCADCMICYYPASNGFIIIEMLKSDQNKIKRMIKNG